MSGQGALATLATITGGKLLWDTSHVMTGRNPVGGFSSDAALVTTRFTTVVLDSL